MFGPFRIADPTLNKKQTLLFQCSMPIHSEKTAVRIYYVEN